MRRTLVLWIFGAAVPCAPRAVAAESPPLVPVTIHIVGRGEIRLLVADGASRPCDASDDRVLFRGRASAGDSVIALESATGSICVDHTYGALRESQWAGPEIWSGRVTYPGGPEPSIQGTVSTEEP